MASGVLATGLKLIWRAIREEPRVFAVALAGSTAFRVLTVASAAVVGELVGTVETIEPGGLADVIADVAEIQPFWAQLSLEDRGRYLKRTAEVLVDEVDEVARAVLQARRRRPAAS